VRSVQAGERDALRENLFLIDPDLAEEFITKIGRLGPDDDDYKKLMSEYNAILQTNKKCYFTK